MFSATTRFSFFIQATHFFGSLVHCYLGSFSDAQKKFLCTLAFFIKVWFSLIRHGMRSLNSFPLSFSFLESLTFLKGLPLPWLLLPQMRNSPWLEHQGLDSLREDIIFVAPTLGRNLLWKRPTLSFLFFLSELRAAPGAVPDCTRTCVFRIFLLVGQWTWVSVHHSTWFKVYILCIQPSHLSETCVIFSP